MKPFPKEIPPECLEAFLRDIDTPEPRLPHRVIIVDEVLPPELIRQIDERLEREELEKKEKRKR